MPKSDWCIENDFAAQKELAEVERYNGMLTRKEIAALLARVARLEEALRKIADGRGMIPDKSTIYMNGKVPEIPKYFNKYDMQEIARRALEEK